MMEWIIAALAGAVTGVLSGFGVGGGSLLLIYMTSFAGLAQNAAQGINLLYFLPTAHFKNGYVEKRVLLPAVCAGLVCSALTAWAATALDVDILRKCFGGFLIVIGLRELLKKDNKG